MQVAALSALSLLGVLGCAGDDDDAAPAPRKPDTGYGAGQPVPDPRTCTDFCTRLGGCSATLCNEDTKSTRYDALAELIVSACEAQCTDTIVNSNITAQQWQCLFQSSCRQVLDYDTCATGSSYFCN